jgi:hypothetical protein
MKKVILCLFLSGLSQFVSAQQNLFNVPSSDITVKKGVFFQQQLNINNIIQSNTNLCYGLGNGFEIGANLIGVQINNHFNAVKINDSLDAEPAAPLGLFTFQKVFTVTKDFKIGIGTQVGGNLFKHANKPELWANFTYLNTKSSFFDEKLSVNAGVYVGNRVYIGEKKEVSFMSGFEAIVAPKLHLVGDIIGGRNAIGVAVMGFIYYAKPKLPLSFGWQIPNSKLITSAFVFEITYVPGS